MNKIILFIGLILALLLVSIALVVGLMLSPLITLYLVFKMHYSYKEKMLPNYQPSKGTELINTFLPLLKMFSNDIKKVNKP